MMDFDAAMLWESWAFIQTLEQHAYADQSHCTDWRITSETMKTGTGA